MRSSFTILCAVLVHEPQAAEPVAIAVMDPGPSAFLEFGCSGVLHDDRATVGLDRLDRLDRLTAPGA